MAEALLHPDAAGLYCQPGGFHIDPWLAVDVAVITHAHSDHARGGSKLYYCAAPTAPLLRIRLGAQYDIRGIPYGEVFALGATRVSFHPAGHVLGSAQVRVEAGPRGSSEVWVASGDYKRAADPTCAGFEVVPCDTFITEATFALPIYRWDDPAVTGSEMWEWWEMCAGSERACVLLGYSLGKVQRALAEIARAAKAAGKSVGPIFSHGAPAALTQAYRDAGVELPEVKPMPEKSKPANLAGSLTIAPPGAAGSSWMRRFGADDRYQTAFASGWMRIRGVRRRGAYDRGFVLSDHADWPGLVETIRQTGASRVLVTHGNIDSFVRYLRETGVQAEALRTVHGTEEED